MRQRICVTTPASQAGNRTCGRAGRCSGSPSSGCGGTTSARRHTVAAGIRATTRRLRLAAAAELPAARELAALGPPGLPAPWPTRPIRPVRRALASLVQLDEIALHRCCQPLKLGL